MKICGLGYVDFAAYAKRAGGFCQRHRDFLSDCFRNDPGRFYSLACGRWQCLWCPAGIRTPNQQIMRRFEGHQQGETKRDNPVFTDPQPSK
jgi:hypothetical protein